jgi:hypothetical protein
MADAGNRVDCMGKILSFEPEGGIHQADQHRHLDQGTDHRGKRLAGIDAEHGHRHGDGQLEIIGSGRKTQRRGLFIGGARPSWRGRTTRKTSPRNRCKGARRCETRPKEAARCVPFEGKHHQDGEKQRNQGYRADFRNERLFIPLFAFGFQTDEAGKHPTDERNSQINEDALGNLADGDIDHHTLHAKPLRQHRDKYISVDRKEEHLENRIEGHQAGAVFTVSGGQVIPHDHHCDATGQTDEDQANHSSHGDRKEMQWPAGTSISVRSPSFGSRIEPAP